MVDVDVDALLRDSHRKQFSRIICLLRLQDLWAVNQKEKKDQKKRKKSIIDPNLILTIHASLDMPRLNEVHYMIFNLFNLPTECSTHSIKFNRIK